MHIVGLAAIIGPYLVQWRLEKRFEVRVMLAGTIAQLVTGVGLVIVRGANERDITPGMVAVKLFVTVLIAAAMAVVIALQRTGRMDAASRPWFHTAGIAAIANVLIAVVWA